MKSVQSAIHSVRHSPILPVSYAPIHSVRHIPIQPVHSAVELTFAGGFLKPFSESWLQLLVRMGGRGDRMRRMKSRKEKEEGGRMEEGIQ